MNAYQMYGGKPELGPARDLTGDNELPQLLEEREELQRRMAADRERLEEIKRLLEAKLGEASRGVLPGWSLFWVTRSRRAYSVDEGTYRFIWAERVTTRQPKTSRMRKPALVRRRRRK
jgi:hypothetical protein